MVLPTFQLLAEKSLLLRSLYAFFWIGKTLNNLSHKTFYLRGAKFNSRTKDAWSKLVSAYSMHISTSLPKKVSGVHRFEPTTAGTGELVLGAKIRYFTFLPISPQNEQI